MIFIWLALALALAIIASIAEAVTHEQYEEFEEDVSYANRAAEDAQALRQAHSRKRSGHLRPAAA